MSWSIMSRSRRRIPRPVVRATVAAALRPILSPRAPIRLQRRLLDLNRHTLPLPSATRRYRTVLGCVPAERVVRVEHPLPAALALVSPWGTRPRRLPRACFR